MRALTIFISLIALLSAPAFAKVSFKGALDVTLFPQDQHLYGLDRVFDLSELKYPATVSVTPFKKDGHEVTHGAGYTYNDAYFTKTYAQLEEQELNFVRFLDNQTIAFVHGNTRVTVQSISLDGKNIGVDRWTYDFQVQGATLICEDIILNPERDMIYIGCVSKNPSENDSSTIFVHQVEIRERPTRDTIHTISLGEEDLHDWVVRHRLQLGLFRVPQDGKDDSEEHFLFVWDQGVSVQAKTRDNARFYYFEHVDSGDLLKGGYVEIPPTFEAFYDLINYNGKLLATGRRGGSSGIITITQCNFIRAQEEMLCPGTPRPTNVKEGFVGFFNTGQFFEFDRQKKTVKVYDVTKPISDPDWLGTPLYQYDNVPVLDDKNQWVRRFEGNRNHGILHWTKIGPTDSGVTILSRGALNLRQHDEGVSGAIIGDLYLRVEKNTLQMKRLGLPFYYVVADLELFPGDNAVEIKFKDQDNEAKGKINIHVLLNAWAKVDFGHSLPYIDAYEGTFFEIPFTLFDVNSGNGLHYELTFDDKAEGVIEPAIFNDYPIDVVYDPPLKNNVKWREYEIIAGHVIGQDKGQRLFYFSCYSERIRELICRKEYNPVIQDQSEVLQRGIFSHQGVAFAWTQANDHVGAYFFSKSQGVSRHRLDGRISSAALTHNGAGDLLATFAFKDKVSVYKLNPHNHDEWELEEDIKIGDIESEFWCPRTIRTDALEPTDIHVLSYCPNQKDQRIVKLSLANYLSRRGSVAIPIEVTAPDFCPQGTEYIIYSKGEKQVIYSVNEMEDIARYDIPIDADTGFDIHGIISVQCNSAISQFTVISQGNHDNEQNIQVFWGNLQRRAQIRMQHYVPDVKAARIESFASHHGLIHVIYDKEGEIRFLQTSTIGPIMTADVNFTEHLKEDIKVKMTIKASNQHYNNQVSHDVIIRKPYRGLKVEVIGNPDGDVGSYDLEQFVRIIGPVFRAELYGSKELSFKKRISLEDKVSTKDTPEYQMSFDQFKTKGDVSVGFKNSDFLTSTVGFITNENSFNSVYYTNSILSFDFDVLQNGKIFFVSSQINHSGTRAELQGLVWDTKTKSRVIVHDSEFLAYCDKLKIVAKKSRDYLIFCHVFHLERVHIYEAKITSSSITFENLHSTEDGTWHWDVVEQKDHIYVYWSGIHSEKLYGIAISKEDEPTIKDLQPFALKDKKYHIGGIAAGVHDDKNNMIAINTHGTRILDCVAPATLDQVKLDCIELDKYRDFDGSEIYINQDYIIHYASTRRAPYDSAVLVWKRRSPKSLGQIFYAIDLSGRAVRSAPQTSHYLQRKQKYSSVHHRLRSAMNPASNISAPISVTLDADKVTTIVLPTQDPAEPAEIYKVGNFEVIVPLDADIDFSKAIIDFEGEATEPLVLDEVFKYENPRPKFNPWPFVLIILILLALAVAWFAYGRSKDTEERETLADTDGNYMSLGKQTLAKRTEYDEEDLNEADAEAEERERAE